MPLMNLFFWLILLLSGFAVSAILAAQFRAEQRARRELTHLNLHRDIRHSSGQVHYMRSAPDILPDERLETKTAFFAIEYEPAADSTVPAVSFDWPRSDRTASEHTGQLDHSSESERHNCA